MTNERSPSRGEEEQPKISVSSALERDSKELVRGLFSLGTENLKFVDDALKELGYAALEDMISENYFEGISEVARGAVAHLIRDMKYATDTETRKQVAHQLAQLIEKIGFRE